MATKAKPKRKRLPPVSHGDDADSGEEQRAGPVLESEEQGFEIKPKDFRLLHAQRYAADEIKRIKPPKTDKELRAAIKKVATAVATRLYTSPALALSAYIDPDVWKKWKRVSKTPGESPKYSVVAKKAKKIDELLVERFRARWKAVETDFANGVDVAKARAHRFLASDSRARMRLARRYYTPSRAAKFARSSVSEILGLCWVWFNPFQVFAHASGSELSEIGDHLDVLIDSEYVAMTWGLFYNFQTYDVCPSYDNPGYPELVEEFYSCHPPFVCPFPDLSTTYGDILEGIVYSYRGERLRVSKSITEPFLDAERVDAMDEIEQRFLRNASHEGDDPRTWRVNFRRLTTFLSSEYGRALIEADIFGDVGSPGYKEDFQMLKEELRANGNGYLKRPRVRL